MPQCVLRAAFNAAIVAFADAVEAWRGRKPGESGASRRG